MRDLVRILFVCHGNICRSTMAEFVMKDLVEQRGLAERCHIESAATSAEELGNPVHPSTRAILQREGIDCSGKVARQMRRSDYDGFDLLIGMDDQNIRNMLRILGGDTQGKVHKLLEFAGREGSIADPWYTGDFDVTYDDVLAGCVGLLGWLGA